MALVPFNHRRIPCPRCGRLDCFVQGFEDQRFESWCLLCGFVQSWEEQVRADRWRYGPKPVIEIAPSGLRVRVVSAVGAPE